MAKETKNLSAMTKEELAKREAVEQAKKEQKAERKAVVDQVLRILGLIMATMIFLISFSMFAPLTVFGWIFNNGIDPKTVWIAMDIEDNLFRFGGDSFYAILTGGDPTIAVWLTTAIQVALGTLLAVLISIYVRDMIGVIKNFLGIGRNIIVETAEGVKEGAEELLGIDGKKRKRLFGDSDADSKKTVIKKEKPVAPVKAKDPIELLTPEQADLVLAGKAKLSDFVKEEVKPAVTTTTTTQPTTETQSTQADTSPRKSIFDGRR